MLSINTVLGFSLSFVTVANPTATRLSISVATMAPPLMCWKFIACSADIRRSEANSLLLIQTALF